MRESRSQLASSRSSAGFRNGPDRVPLHTGKGLGSATSPGVRPG